MVGAMGMIEIGMKKMKGYICDFLRKCNGFRVM